MDDKLKETLLSTFKQFDEDDDYYLYDDFEEFIPKEELEKFSNSNNKKK